MEVVLRHDGASELKSTGETAQNSLALGADGKISRGVQAFDPAKGLLGVRVSASQPDPSGDLARLEQAAAAAAPLCGPAVK